MTRLLAGLLAAAVCCHAAGHISGTIRDSSQAVVPGVAISCFGEDSGLLFETSSNTDGTYALTVPGGSYNIIVRREGFHSIARIGIDIPSEGALRADFELRPASFPETITITSAPEDGSGTLEPLGHILRPENLRSLPHNDGTVTGLLALAPGVLFTPASRGEPGQFSSAGARPNTNFFSIDGISANNATAGAGWPSFLPGERLPAMTSLGSTHNLAILDAVESIAVETSGTSSSVPGASIAIQTRPGTNDLHGSFFWNVRPDALGANDWFANRYVLGRDAPALSEEGGSLGGPLRRDTTFFFLAAERLSLDQGYAWTTTVPSLNARGMAPSSLQSLLNEFPLPNGPDLTFGISQLIGESSTPASLYTASARLDHQLSKSTRAFLRLAETPSWSRGGLTQVVQTRYRNQIASFGLTSTTGRWTQSSRLSYSRNEAASTWLAEPSVASLPAFYSQYPSLAAEFSNIVVGGAGSVSLGQDGHNLQDHWQASHQAAFSASHHQLRFGLDYMAWHPMRNGPQQSATLAFGTTFNSISGPTAPVWITYSHPEASSVHFGRASAFFEDTWNVSSAFTLTLGLRASYLQPPSLIPAANLFSVDESSFAFNPILQNSPLWGGSPTRLIPYIAGAWRLTPRGDTVLRASWALLEDTGSSVSTDQLNGIPYRELRSATGNVDAGVTGLLPFDLGYGYANNLRLPTYQRWNVQLQHEWSHRDTLELAYSGLTGSSELRREITFPSASPIGALTFASSDGSSSYHGLNVLYRHALAQGLQASVGYTWSHSIDLNSADSTVFFVSPAVSALSDRASSDFDARHTLNLAATYTSPARSGNFASRLSSNWTLGAMAFARSGFPVDVLVSETLDGFAIANYRPTRLAGVPTWIADPSAPGGLVLNPNAFGYPFPGEDPESRNSIRGFGMWQTDVAAERPFFERSGLRVSFRADAYNLANTPRFADPVRFASNPLFGQSQSALNLMLGGGSPSSGQSPAFLMGAPRSLQLSLRVTF